MRLPEDPGFPVLPPGQPMRDLLLAQALDACITAERRLPGSSQEIISRQPTWARGELQRLIGLAGSLDAAASNAIMSSEFKVAARERLMQRIGGDAGLAPRRAFVALPAQNGLTTAPPPKPAQLSAVAAHRPPQPSPRPTRRTGPWVWRAAAGLLAAVLAGAATVTASASALPGELLYSVKQAQEELGIRLAADDQERALALLRQADARLDETARLLQQGRTVDANETALRYDQILERAMTSYVVTRDVARPGAPSPVGLDARLSQDEDQLQAMLKSAPEQARADLQQALVVTERGRALVADSRPVERAVSRSGASAAVVAAALPTAETVPTEPAQPAEAAAAEAVAVAEGPAPTAVPGVAPTIGPTVRAESPTAVPTERPAVTATPAVVVADVPEERDEQERERDQDRDMPMLPLVARTSASANRGAPATVKPVTPESQHHGSGQPPNAAAAPALPTPVVAGVEMAGSRQRGDDRREVDRTELVAQLISRSRLGPGADDTPQPVATRLPVRSVTAPAAATPVMVASTDRGERVARPSGIEVRRSQRTPQPSITATPAPVRRGGDPTSGASRSDATTLKPSAPAAPTVRTGSAGSTGSTGSTIGSGTGSTDSAWSAGSGGSTGSAGSTGNTGSAGSSGSTGSTIGSGTGSTGSGTGSTGSGTGSTGSGSGSTGGAWSSGTGGTGSGSTGSGTGSTGSAWSSGSGGSAGSTIGSGSIGSTSGGSRPSSDYRTWTGLSSGGDH